MRGAGSAFFAVWGYVISHMMPCRGSDKGTRVELNTEVVAFLIGERPEVVQAQIERMCQPDPKSRTKAEGGRRLLRLGEFEFLVVNGDKYRAIRDEESRREQNREAQQRHRERLKRKGALMVPPGTPIAGAIKGRVEADPITQADRQAVAQLPSTGKTLVEVFADEAARAMQEKSGMGEVPRVLTAAQVEMLARAEASGDKVTVQRLRGLLGQAGGV